MIRIFIIVVLSVFLNKNSLSQVNTDSQQLFESLKPAIVQIKILSKTTGEKASIGSGFIIEKDNLIATNYHVISQIATQPNEFNGKYRTVDNKEGTFELIIFDVINDLALLRADQDIAPALNLAPLPPKGASLFSLGNPHDLGFVIVDGVNNGIIPESNPPQVFFSASINSGMSGGPTVNKAKNVVAVNVAVKRQSGDISFLVPGEFLRKLIDTAKKDFFIPPSFPEASWDTLIETQLQSESENYYQNLAVFPRQKTVLGGLQVPSKIGIGFKCWNISANEEEKDWAVQRNGFNCTEARQHFISDNEYHGYLSLGFQHFKAKSPISRRQFYRHIESQQRIQSFRYFSNKEDNKKTANCTSEFVHIAQHEFKLHICAQKDKKRKGIALVKVLGTSVDQDNEAWILQVTADGAAIKDVLNLTKQLITDIKPAN